MSTTNAANPAASPPASSPPPAPSNSFDGEVVSVTGNTLVMSNPNGKQFSKTLASDAKLTCDGADCRADELQAGRKIRVTTKAGDRRVVTRVESLHTQSEFIQCK